MRSERPSVGHMKKNGKNMKVSIDKPVEIW